MPRVSFDELPDHGRLWVFPVSRALETEEEGRLLAEVDAFLDGWAAHGRLLRSARRLVEGRFLLVGVDVDAEAPSGCSIDALVHRLRDLAERRGFTLTDHEPVRYRPPQAPGEIRAVPRGEFRRLAAEEAITPEVRVFDTTLTRVGDLRHEGLERPARTSWHARAFFRARPDA